ncbi:hypothetical protein RFI_14652 [Reticulomyxa filosa]|uniref:Uncharacterized protein n=1 Tax=Reticulomyxa filosa TaxID=46433 RepID=X6N9X3_RETFI|nr:hypothetical protein RFI_14652 [Reticulomyxa filosa]|eukprot:ETO22549.1 hypothetical protein RFI_14652 [Reticulomyxa filosa]
MTMKHIFNFNTAFGFAFWEIPPNISFKIGKFIKKIAQIFSYFFISLFMKNSVFNCFAKKKLKQHWKRLKEPIVDKENDLNLLIELKVLPRRRLTFMSIPIPLKHSFRTKDENHTLCVITRTKDAQIWENILLHDYKIKNLAKIMGVKEFLALYKDNTDVQNLCDIFDLFIVHPSVFHFVVPVLTVPLKQRNKLLRVT